MTESEVKIRSFPSEIQRVETGPIQFGDDWPGTFLRGDTAAGYALYLSQMLKWVEQQPGHIDPFVLGPVRSLLGDLQASNLASSNPALQVGE